MKFENDLQFCFLSIWMLKSGLGIVGAFKDIAWEPSQGFNKVWTLEAINMCFLITISSQV